MVNTPLGVRTIKWRQVKVKGSSPWRQILQQIDVTRLADNVVKCCGSQTQIYNKDGLYTELTN